MDLYTLLMYIHIPCVIQPVTIVSSGVVALVISVTVLVVAGIVVVVVVLV